MSLPLLHRVPKPGISDPADLAAALGRILDARTGASNILIRNPFAEAVTFWLRQSQVVPHNGAAATLFCSLRLFRQVVQQMEFTILSEQRISALERLFGLQPAPDRQADPLVYSQCIVQGERCVLDGKDYKILRGNWAFYVPALQAKILHARHGMRWCFHESCPSAEVLASEPGDLRLGPYALDDWRKALATPVFRRIAENRVSARRLAKAGVGPAAGRPIIIKALAYQSLSGSSPSGGFELADLTGYLPRRQSVPADLAVAGVALDHIGSALRQQIRGYVSDLDSVIGVSPLDAEEEVRACEMALWQAAARA